MNSRLTIQDLAGLLAEYTTKDKSSIEHFLKEFVSVLSEGVCADRIVKVKGLGTFKVIEVEKRESIHVNTGERFVIPEHYKFSFLPDKELKDLVNKPFSFFDTIEINENVDFPDVDIFEESEDTDEKDTEDESIEEMIPEEIVLPVNEQNAETEDLPEEQYENEENTAIPEVKEPEILPPIQEPEPIKEIHNPVSEENQIEKEPVRKKKFLSSKMLVSIIVAFVLFGAVNVGLYMNRGFFTGADTSPIVADVPVTPLPSDSSQLSGSGELAATDTTTKKMPSDTAVAKSTGLQEKPENAVKSISETSKVLAKIKIASGDRLTLISLKYYGSKIFWVYLYEYNKSVIKDPNNVAIGTTIEVPSPEIYGIDIRDRSSVEKAAARQAEILNGKL